MGLARVAQVIRMHRHTRYVRQAKVYKETDETVFAVIFSDPGGGRPGTFAATGSGPLEQ